MPDLLQHLFAGVCGQNLAHTWTPGGVPLPCCQRCTGLYVGAFAGAALHLWFKPRLTSRFLWIHGVFLLQMIPFGFHWLPQGPFVRTITGTLFGFGLVSFFWLLPTARRPVGDGVHPEVLGAPASAPARSSPGLGPVHAGPEAGAPHGGTASTAVIWCAGKKHSPAGDRDHRRVRLNNRSAAPKKPALKSLGRQRLVSPPTVRASSSRQLPLISVLAGEELAGFRVADDYFLRSIPLDLPTDEHGDQPQVAGNGGVVGDFDRGDGALA